MESYQFITRILLDKLTQFIDLAQQAAIYHPGFCFSNNGLFFVRDR